jgi:hypothetical protein
MARQVQLVRQAVPVLPALPEQMGLTVLLVQQALQARAVLTARQGLLEKREAPALQGLQAQTV